MASTTGSLNTKRPELTVFGYVRKNYAHHVPLAILGVMESFYSLWIRWRFSKEDLQREAEANYLSRQFIHIHRARINGTNLDFWLQWNNAGLLSRKRTLSLFASFPPDIESVVGYFAVTSSTVLCGQMDWKQYGGSNSKQLLSAFSHNSEADSALSVLCYLDVVQMEFKEAANKVDFDMAPPISRHVRFQWECQEESRRKYEEKSGVAQLSSYPVSVTHYQEGWKTKCCVKEVGVKMKGKWSWKTRTADRLTFSIDHCLLPLSIQCYEIIATLRYQYKAMSMAQRSQSGEFVVDIDPEDPELPASVDIEIEIKSLEDTEEKVIKKRDWVKHGVV